MVALGPAAPISALPTTKSPFFNKAALSGVLKGEPWATTLAEAIEGGPLDAPIAEAKLHKMERGDYAPEFPLEWALKDVDLALGAAGGDDLPLLAALSRQWRKAVDAGHGRDDVSAARLALGGHQQP